MLNDKLIIATILAIITSLCLGFYAGQDWASTKAEAEQAKHHQAYMAEINKQLGRARDLSERLAKAEGVIVTKTVEVIKYVPQVTTGKPCLSPAAVSLLQPGSNPGLRPPTSEPAAEGPANFIASDTDVAYWIADANRHYEVCAERLNTLVDYVDGATK